MTTTLNFARRALRGSTALQALALLGAGVGGAGIATPAAAQDYTQVNATGRVQSTGGQPIAGATVTVTSNDQGFTRTVTTDSSGAFRVPALPQGSYTFSIEADGYDSFTDPAVNLNQGSAANQFTLAAAGASASGEIVVTAGRVQVVDFDRNTTGAVINVGELATRVPVARDVTSVVLLSPGAAAGDTAFGNLPSINGASVSENVYYLNGLNITQFRNGLGAVAVPFDFYRTIDIKNGGIPAEFGRTTGGVINAVTKSGSNEFHGGITFNWEPNDLRSRAPNTYAADNDSSYSSRRDFIAQLSGPIIKDHLFFYGIYNARDVRSGGGSTATASSTATGVNGCASNPTLCQSFADLDAANLKIVGSQYIMDKNNSPFYGGKLDAVIVDGQRLEATYFNTSALTLRNIYGTSGTTAGVTRTLANGLRYNAVTNSPGGYASSTVFRSGGENYVIRYTGTFTNWLTLSGAYGRNYNRDTTESSTTDIPSIIDQRNGGSANIGNVTANSSFNFDKRTFYRADADLYFKILGSHHIRGGFDREDLDESSTTSANGGYQFTLITAGGASGQIDPTSRLLSGTTYVKARTFVTGGNFTTQNEAFYLQDSWQLLENRLALNLGVRNDRFVSRNGAGETFYKSGNLWAPRLGFSFDPEGTGRARVYGSFSRYYLPVAVNTNVRLAGGELDYDTYYQFTGLGNNNIPNLTTPLLTYSGARTCPGGSPAGTACVIRNDGSIPDTGSTVASNLNAQSTDEYILGGEARIGSRIKIGAFFTYTNLNESLEDAALDQAIVPYCISQGKTAAACRSVWDGAHQFALINPGSDVVVDLSDPLPGETSVRTNVTLPAGALGYPRATRKYRAMSFTFDREFDGKWDLHLNYTYSKLFGNIEGGVRSDNGQSDSGLTTAFDFPALVYGTYGYLPNDRRHNFKAYGSYKFGDILTVGLNGQIASPRKFGCYGLAPASADYNSVQVNGITGQNYGTAAAYCNLANGQVVRNPVGYTVVNDPFDRAGGPRPSTLQLVRRGTSFQSDWLYLLNLDVALKVPTDAFDGTLRLSVFNVLNHKSKLDFQEVGTLASGAPSAAYSLPLLYQTPRYARIQFGVNF